MENQFESLDNDLVKTSDLGQLQEPAKRVHPWIKGAAIASIIYSILSLIILFVTPEASSIIGGLMGTIIGISLSAVLFSSGQALEVFSKSLKEKDFEEAMLRQKIYWVSMGIMIILGIVVFLLAFATSIGSVLR